MAAGHTTTAITSQLCKTSPTPPPLSTFLGHSAVQQIPGSPQPFVGKLPRSSGAALGTSTSCKAVWTRQSNSRLQNTDALARVGVWSPLSSASSSLQHIGAVGYGNLYHKAFVPAAQPSCARSPSFSLSSRGDNLQVACLHTVDEGETLWSIAWEYGVRVQDLVQANRISNMNHVELGEVLFIPPHSAGVRDGDVSTSVSAGSPHSKTPRASPRGRNSREFLGSPRSPGRSLQSRRSSGQMGREAVDHMEAAGDRGGRGRKHRGAKPVGRERDDQLVFPVAEEKGEETGSVVRMEGVVGVENEISRGDGLLAGLASHLTRFLATNPLTSGASQQQSKGFSSLSASSATNAQGTLSPSPATIVSPAASPSNSHAHINKNASRTSAPIASTTTTTTTTAATATTPSTTSKSTTTSTTASSPVSTSPPPITFDADRTLAHVSPAPLTGFAAGIASSTPSLQVISAWSALSLLIASALFSSLRRLFLLSSARMAAREAATARASSLPSLSRILQAASTVLSEDDLRARLPNASLRSLHASSSKSNGLSHSGRVQQGSSSSGGSVNGSVSSRTARKQGAKVPAVAVAAASSGSSSNGSATVSPSLPDLTPEEVARDYKEIQRSYEQGMNAAYEAFLRDSGAATGGRFRGGLPSKFKSKGTNRGGGGGGGRME